jgi:hypothetical protein
MELRSHSRPLAERIVNPSDDVQAEYSFPAANEWGRAELKLLNVDFIRADNKGLKRRIKDRITQRSERLQQSIALVGLT